MDFLHAYAVWLPLLARSREFDKSPYAPYIVCAIMAFVGVILVFSGRRSIRTKTFYGNYGQKVEGKTAVAVGWSQIIMAGFLWLMAVVILLWKAVF